VGLEIDDFGTGYSSLSNLCRLPFDTLKIDRSFVSELSETGKRRQGCEIVKSVILLAAGLGLSSVAEGIETKCQADKLRSLGCRFGQGYYFSEAVDADAARQLLLENPHFLAMEPLPPGLIDFPAQPYARTA
jgi:EAL domain-containing protein (putative c-di-GMP-specific phosphodiesterase class I)